MTRTITSTTADPIRIDAKHYQIPSLSKSRAGTLYNLRFNDARKRWSCDCYDALNNDLENCKHVRRLRAWIKAQMESSQAHREATAISDRDSLLEEQLAGMQLAMAQQAEMIQELAAKVEALELGARDPEAEADRLAWEEFERDPAAGRARQAEHLARILERRVNILSDKVHSLQVESRSGLGAVAVKRETPRDRRTGGALNGNRAFSIERR